MKILRGHKRKTAWMLILIMLITLIPVDGVNLFSSNALVVGSDAEGNMDITKITYSKQHAGFSYTGSYIEIRGTNLTGVPVLFKMSSGDGYPGGFTSAGTKSSSSNDSFLHYDLTYLETKHFLGEVDVNGTSTDLSTAGFPNITGVDKGIINQDDESNDTLVFNGNYLTGINQTSIVARYGTGIFASMSTTTDASKLTLADINAPDQLGNQDIYIKKIDPSSDLSVKPAIEVEYYYADAFRIIKNLGLTNLSMYPTAASQGESVYLTADNFNDSAVYGVYFLGEGETYADYNKSASVTLSTDKSKLTVTVPQNSTITSGTKTVKVVQFQSGEIVAETTVSDPFSLISASSKPSITWVNPDHGPDTGSSVQIKGRNLLTLSLPNLSWYNGVSAVSYSDGEMQMDIAYKLSTTNPDSSVSKLTYQGNEVTEAKRTVKATIGDKCTFERENGAVKYEAGTDDFIYVKTAAINDAATDPVKDVLLEIVTTLTTKDALTAALKTYTYHQSALDVDGYTFDASSVQPTITTVNPEIIQVTSSKKMKENTLISIEGSNFFVNKYTDTTDGTVHTNYPVVTIQNSDALGTGSFELLFDKNGDSNSTDGRIYTGSSYDDGAGTGPYLEDSDGNPVPVDMVVLNASNEVVDGTAGNETGTRIVLYLPTLAGVDAEGKKNIQVINPRREALDLGDEAIALDILDFVAAGDTPIIESVSPNIVTVDGGDQVTVTGTNIQSGVKVYLDGKLVTAVTRTVDVQGSDILLTFKAPAGRLGKTQLALVNPLGGLAVQDFYYVSSYNKDPAITTVAPNKGSTDTLVVITGDNYFKPDPTVANDSGVNAYRLLGSRVFLDGKDVNSYNKDALANIEFRLYTAPDPVALFTADTANDRVRTSSLYRNAVVTDLSGGVFKINFDVDGDPALYKDDSLVYSLKVDSGDNAIHCYAADGTDQGVAAVTVDEITLDGASFLEVEMDNNILAVGKDAIGNVVPRLADYWYSVVASNAAQDGYFTFERLSDGTIRLSNGQLNQYTIILNDTEDGFIAVSDNGGEQELTVTDSSVTLEGEGAGGLTLDLRTPYIFDTKNVITGNRVKVVNKYQIQFTVPFLSSGQGAKDIAVENPDTKRATLTKGFFYYANPASSPAIAAIVPSEGSVSGGYLITLTGKDFEESSRVYIDGVAVATADTAVNLDGTALTVKVPKYSYDLADYDTDRITVPVVVLNQDGGSAVREDGFTYVSPSSTPTLSQLITSSGSTIGGEIVEIIGYDFRFFEPYKNLGGGASYDVGIDTFTNLNGGLAGVTKKWDSLLNSHMDGTVDLREPVAFTNDDYTQYFSSPILPKVYFGGKQAKIVDFANGYLKVVTPANSAGAMDVYVVNNDSGISNKLKYTYKSSSPKINYISPDTGARIGQETRDLFGTGFAKFPLPGYTGDIVSGYADEMPGVDSLVRFADITNRGIAVGQENDGRINSERASISLEGDLTVDYDGSANTVTVTVEEGGATYTRTFEGYDDKKLLIPMGMLKSKTTPFPYYVPDGYNDAGTTYNTETNYELILVEVDTASKRFYVERGYAPQTSLKSASRITLDTPSYWTIGQVNVTLKNPDGGVATTKFTYRNPASVPTIELINPQATITGESAYMVQASVKGGTTIEIKGHDFWDGVKVYLDQTEMDIQEITTDNTDPTDPLDVIIAKVPAGKDTDIGTRYPIIVENTDGGIANSTDPKTLTKVETDTTKWPIYFIYRKPLSDPVILTVTPSKSSIYVNSSGVGNEIVLTGTDFRTGAKVYIGAMSGVPITPTEVEAEGRYIKFKIPANLTVGVKDINVINTDFGTGTLASAITIVSYPQITSIKSADNTADVEWVSVEGGTKIRLNGSGFDSGAKVYFGGTRTVLDEASTDANSGLWRDNTYIEVTDGIAATAVTFVDATALTVTVPAVLKEKEFTVTVINGDTGISDGDTTVQYSVPVPSTPLNLDAQIVNNKYIKLYGYTSSNFDYYEIYTFIGSKSVSKLESDNYKDFRYLATAQTEPYKITKLAGLDEMDDDDRVYLVLKAVNKYGPSNWSNIAYLKYSEINDIKGGLGIEDFDGNLDVPTGKVFSTEVAAQQAVVTISKTDLKGMTTIDMTGSAYSVVRDTVVNVPEAVVESNYNRINVKMGQGQLSFYPAVLNTYSFQRIAQGDKVDTYANLRFEPVTTEYAGMIQRNIPRELKAYSPLYRVSTAATSNAGTSELYEMAGAMDLALRYQSLLPTGFNAYTLKLYWYDAAASRWIAQSSSVDLNNRLVSGQVSRPGIYIILGPR